MVTIFTELAISNLVKEKHSIGWWIFFLVNYILFIFFLVEIALKFLAYGPSYFFEFINFVDSVIVISSFILHVKEV